MEQTIKRLQASKAQFIEQQRAEGIEFGKEWATEVAEYAELVAVVAVNYEAFSDGDDDLIQHLLVDVLEYNVESEVLFGDQANVSNAVVMGFIDGARAVWEEVSQSI